MAYSNTYKQKACHWWLLLPSACWWIHNRDSNIFSHVKSPLRMAISLFYPQINIIETQ